MAVSVRQQFTVLVSTISLLLVLVPGRAFGLPRLAAEHGSSCMKCHLNPTGGGMRNEYGNQEIAFEELCFPQTRYLLASHKTSPRLGNLAVGFDSRHRVDDDGTVVRLQSDVYAAVNIYQDCYFQARFNEDGLSEHYALLSLSERLLSLKAGRFEPAFGLYQAGRDAFVRSRTGPLSDVFIDGVCLGAAHLGANLAVGAFNHDQQDVFSLHMYGAGKLYDIGYLMGASWRVSRKIDGSYRDYPHAKALFGGLSWYRLTVTGELDLVGEANDTLITYSSLAVRLMNGLYVIGEYNFFDSNRHYATGVDEYFKAGLEIFPLPYVELRPMFSYYSEGYREDESEFTVQLHIGY